MTRITIPILIMLLSVAQKSEGQTKPKCPPIVFPVLNYQYQPQLQSGIGAELNLWFCPKTCDCNSSFGGLCYLYGPTASLRTTYYPAIKAFDISASYGYRSLGIPFFKPELNAGYTFIDRQYGSGYFHIDPAIGFDAAVLNISLGYSFRSEKINTKPGAFVFRLGFSPSVFFADSKAKKTLASNSRSGREQLRELRKKN